jgi:hypothetical protein
MAVPTLAEKIVPKQFEVELEAGPVWQSRNDVQIPNTTAGTRFSLVDLVGTGPVTAVRTYLTWNINDRQGLRLLLAPLSIEANGKLDSSVDFAGSSFSQDVNAVYKFNSYRITWRYHFDRGERWKWWLGFTAKIRDARIALKNSIASGEKIDLGFVPLLHLAVENRISERLSLRADLDALAGGPGRAEDLSVKLGIDLTDKMRLSVGYRTVEGGADVSEVYTFAWLHYAVASLAYHF